MKPDIEFNIDQLVLEGFSRNEAFTISQSLQSELHQLIANSSLQNTFTKGYHQRNMSLNSISIQENINLEGVGQQIAQSIFNGLSTNTIHNK